MIHSTQEQALTIYIQLQVMSGTVIADYSSQTQAEEDE